MKVLITTLGSSGDLHPLIGIGLELKNQGHTVGFATSFYFKKQVEAQGFTYYEVYPNLDPHLEDLKKFVTDPVKGPELLHKNYIFPELEKSYDSFLKIIDDYDIVLSATLTYFAPIACEVKKKPWISICLSPMLFFSAYDPPILAVLPGLKKWYFSPGFNRWLFKTLFRFSSSWLKPYHELRKKAGIKKDLNPFLKEGFSPYGTLALFSTQFGQPQVDWPNNVCVPGFCFYDNSQPPSNQEALLDFLKTNPQPVLFTLGTTTVMNPGKLYEVFMEAQKKTNFSCIILVGKENYEKYKKYQTDRIFVSDYISYSQIMPKCGLIIHQGGVGTTAQGIRSGNPMIIIPHCNDQYDNADRVRKLGVSQTIPYKKLNAKRLHQLISEVMKSDEMKQKSLALSKQIQSEKTEKEAVKFIQDVFNKYKSNLTSI